MTEKELAILDRELEQYLSSLLGSLGRVERCQALRWYATGLLLCGERKSMAPMAARLAQTPAEENAVRQRLQQAVTQARWEEALVYQALQKTLLDGVGGIEALIGDDTGIPRSGNHCVGTARQYSGTLGRVDRCQVIPSLHAAGQNGSFCLGARLYLPESWMADPSRLEKAGVPPDLEFAPKWQIQLALIDQARTWGLDTLPFVADAAYGDVGDFRRALNERQVPYVMQVAYNTCVWAPGTEPEPPSTKADGTTGRPRTRYKSGEHAPVCVAELALSQTEAALQTITWKNGQSEPKTSRFCALRLCPSSGHPHGLAPEPEQWLIWEWPEGNEQPEKYWLSSLSEDVPLERLVYLAKLRWRVERDYQEMKAEVGLDHYEGRTWPGLHHHLVLCAVAHGFLVLQRARLVRDQTENRVASPSRKKTASTEESATIQAAS
jgi:SRSO17 transposase